MPPRTLAALAHALGAAPTADDALVALAEALAEIDRSAEVAVLGFDARRSMLRDRAIVVDGRVRRDALDTTFDHLPSAIRLNASSRYLAILLGPAVAVTARLLRQDLHQPGSRARDAQEPVTLPE